MSYKKVPTWKNGSWSYTEFDTKEDFIAFVKPLFKEPGLYNFDKTAFLFNEQMRNFERDGYYCAYPEGSLDSIKYWELEKEKCREGAIFHGDNTTWYLPRDYYDWINFNPLYNKVKNDYGRVNVYDTQYHVSLYELLAELHGVHAAILKKRQIAMSYFHAAKLLNQLWFEKGPTLKMGASDKRYVDEQGTWEYLEAGRNFRNTHTAWYREMNPGGTGNWQQKHEETVNGKTIKKGNMGKLIALTFERKANTGVGGPCLALGTKVWMADGSLRKVEDLQVGEYVVGKDGYPKKIIRLFTGEDEMYQVDQTRGMSYTVTSQHKLCLKHRDANISEKNRYRLLTPPEWLALTPYNQKVMVGLRNSLPLEFPRKEVLIEPYYLGLWLGDGFRDTTGIIVNETRDPEIVQYLEEYSNRLGGVLWKNQRHRKDYKDKMMSCGIRGKGFGKQVNFNANILIPSFVKYNLFYNKHIPWSYLKNDVETRLQVLAGLIDSDGNYDPDRGRFTIGSSNKRFLRQVARLVTSLGMRVWWGKGVSKTGFGVGNDMFTITIYMENPSVIPTRVARKKGKTRSKDKCKNSTPVFITPVGVQKYAGFECEDNYFLLQDGTITHNCKIFFYEEGGIAKTADKTYGYMRQALRFGMFTTGLFIISGSVGELTECEPLKKFVMNPDDNGFYSVESNLLDENGTIGRTAMFIPEQWSMEPYIDEFGNSLVKEALAALEELYEGFRRTLDPGDYQFEVSQRPRNIKEAFGFRGESEFPKHILSAQRRRIEEKSYPKQYLDIELDGDTGKPKFKASTRSPISDFPISPKTVDKRGCVVVWEKPVKDPPWGAYYASIDPVEKGKTRTSESLCSIYVHKTPFETRRLNDQGELEVVSEQPGMVAAWCGRFDDPNDTNNYLQWIIEMYNAWTVVENNVSTFITHMIGKNLQKYLVPTNQMIFKADLKGEMDTSGYGWRNTGSIFRDNMLQYLKDHIRLVVHQEFTKDGSKVVKTILGVEEIRDIMLITEMEQYKAGLNVDRLIAYTALRVFIAIQEAHRKHIVVDKTKEKEDNKSNFAKLQTSPFRHMGGSNAKATRPMGRNPFKNMR